MNNVTEIKNEKLGESYYEIKHQSGLKILVYPKKNYASSYAMFGTRYGSIDTQFKLSGEKEFTIAPKVGGKFTFANCEYQSAYGKVFCGWKRENGKATYKIVIPANTTAKLILPSGEKTLTAGGNEEYVLKLPSVPAYTVCTVFID